MSAVIPATAKTGQGLVSIAAFRPDGSSQVVAFPVAVAASNGKQERRVIFGYSSATLSARAKARLDALVAKAPLGTTLVSRARGLTTGKVDSPASRLAAARAKAVATYLTTRGIATTYGTLRAQEPVANEARSRRVEALISYRPSPESPR